MIITRTPLRVSFVGGGTDLAAFYRREPGAVLSMAVNKYFYLAMHKFFEEDGFLLKYSKTEHVSDVNEIEHTIIRAVFAEHGIAGVDFSSAADVPGGTGLGSSSAFTVSLLQLVNAHLGRHASQHLLAERACRIEIDVLGNPIGKQDQYGCAIGGLKFIEFNPDESVVVEPIFLRHAERAKLEANLLLFYLGNQRSASAILAEQSKNTSNDTAVFNSLRKMAEQAHGLKRDIQSSVDAVGHYLREAWELKKQLAQGVTNSLVNDAHAAAVGAGALGAKLLGAGSGGFLLTYVPEERHSAVRGALAPLSLHRIKIDPTGSVIIYDDRVE
jgi:D-glycero-alpha-D-manno-heptose-7-phosphate kinase